MGLREKYGVIAVNDEVVTDLDELWAAARKRDGLLLLEIIVPSNSGGRIYTNEH